MVWWMKGSKEGKERGKKKRDGKGKKGREGRENQVETNQEKIIVNSWIALHALPLKF